jgi:hypothetical protein
MLCSEYMPPCFRLSPSWIPVTHSLSDHHK